MHYLDLIRAMTLSDIVSHVSDWIAWIIMAAVLSFPVSFVLKVVGVRILKIAFERIKPLRKKSHVAFEFIYQSVRNGSFEVRIADINRELRTILPNDTSLASVKTLIDQGYLHIINSGLSFQEPTSLSIDRSAIVAYYRSSRIGRLRIILLAWWRSYQLRIPRVSVGSSDRDRWVSLVDLAATYNLNPADFIGYFDFLNQFGRGSLTGSGNSVLTFEWCSDNGGVTPNKTNYSLRQFISEAWQYFMYGGRSLTI